MKRQKCFTGNIFLKRKRFFFSNENALAVAPAQWQNTCQASAKPEIHSPDRKRRKGERESKRRKNIQLKFLKLPQSMLNRH